MANFSKKTIATNKSMTSTFSDVIGEVYGSKFAIETSWVGDCAGTLTVKASADGTNYTKIDTTDWINTNDVAVSGTGNQQFYVNQTNPFASVKIEYTASSGTGTFNAVIVKID